MRGADLAWLLGALALLVVLTVALEAFRDYRECRRGGVVLVEGPARVGVPSHERCIAYLLR